MKPWRVVLLIVGIIVALISFGFLAGGGALVWAHTTQRDADGYFATSAEPLSSAGYALVSEPFDLHDGPRAWVPRDLATFRVASEGSEPVFIGVGPTRDVERYLNDVPHSLVTDVSDDPFRVTYRRVEGDATPGRPASETFWTTTARDGSLAWDVRGGDWSVVVMNPDASRGVRAVISVGVRTSLLLPVGIGLVVAGALLAIGGVVMIVAGARRGRTDAREASIAPARPDLPLAS